MRMAYSSQINFNNNDTVIIAGRNHESAEREGSIFTGTGLHRQVAGKDRINQRMRRSPKIRKDYQN